MPSRSFVAFALLVVLPAGAFAQRGGGTKSNSAPKPTPVSVRYPSVRDIEDYNPASLLVEKRKKFSLSDSAVAQLKALQKSIKERDAQTLAMYDSVRRRLNNSFAQDDSTAPLGMQVESQRNKSGLRNLFGELSARRKRDAQDALDLMPESARKAAADFLKDEADDFERLMPTATRGPAGPPGER